MSALALRDRLRRALPDVLRVATRFPVAVATAAILTAYLLSDWHLTLGISHAVRTWRIPGGLWATLLWATTAVLLAEGLRRPAVFGHALGAAGAAAIAALVILADRIDLSITALLAALALTVTSAPYLRRAADIAAWWRFNHEVGVGLLLAVVATLLFAGGLSAIVESLRYLFGLEISARAHRHIWTVATCFVGPVYALSLVPRDLDRPILEGEPTEFTSRSVAVLVKLILVPLLVVYGAILHVYAIKVAIDGALPKGRLGWMVLSYGAILAATALAAFPTRDWGGPLVRLFWRLWPWLLPVPLVLLFLAVSTRVREYGSTEARYLVVLAGLWLATLVVTQGPLRARFDLRLVPLSLAAMLAVASVGPWGVLGWSVASQVRELTSRLGAAGMLRDGRIAERPTTTLLASDRQRLSSILAYLAERRRLVTLRPLFAGLADDPFVPPATPPTRNHVGFPASPELDTADRIRQRLGIERGWSHRNADHVHFRSHLPAYVEPPEAGALAGPFNLHGAGRAHELGGTRPLRVTVVKSVLTVSETATGRAATFDLGKLARNGGPLAPGLQSGSATGSPLVLQRAGGDLPAILVLLHAVGRLEGDGLEPTSITFWLALGR